MRLPDAPMKKRYFDERIGLFSIAQVDFGTREQVAVTKRFVTRWRLECSDRREGNLCYAKKPVVFYIDPTTPDQWKPWIRKAILDWQPAFEAAGFKDAILAADPPADDPDWSPEDIRHTMVRWLPSVVENSVGPHVSDPRTGEILKGSSQIFHNLTLSVRSASWVHRMGSSPSIMDYSRMNYVAQPEDKIALDDLVPRVGPYDKYAIGWAYREIPNSTVDGERAILESWLVAQDTVPWLRFSGGNAFGGFGTQSEAVGDADPVKSTALGFKNIARVECRNQRCAPESIE